MELSTILSIFGILVSLLFGAWGVYLVIKHRYPGQVTFVREQTIALFDTIVKNLPELAVLYKDKPVGPNLVLIKGALVNTGKKDIAPTMIETPISVSLPADFKWLTAKVVSTSKDVKASIHINDNGALQVTNGLLRCKEFIRFQALAEVPIADAAEGHEPMKTSVAKGLGRLISFESRSGKLGSDERLDNGIKFYHRIEDTRHINTVELKEDERIKKRMRRFVMLPIIGVLFFLGFLLLYYVKGTPSVFVYPIQTDSSHTIDVKIKSLRENRVNVKALDDSFEATYSLDEFFAKSRRHPSMTADTDDFKMMVAMLLFGYVIFPVAILLLRYREYRFNRKLRLLLSIETKDS